MCGVKFPRRKFVVWLKVTLENIARFENITLIKNLYQADYASQVYYYDLPSTKESEQKQT